MRSAGRTSVGSRLACRSASGENSNGSACLRSAISISMPESVALPSTSLMRAIASRLAAGCSTISATTTWPGLRAAQVARRDEQVLVDAAIFGDDEPDAVFLVQAADDFAIGALQHLDDLAFRPAAAIGAGLAQRRAVAVQHLVHFARAQEIVVAAFVRDEEPEAVGMALHGADDEVELGDDAQFALAVGEQLAVALHRRQPAVERLARDGADGEFALEVGGRQRRAGIAQRGQDRFARRQQRRIDVAGARAARITRCAAARQRPASLAAQRCVARARDFLREPDCAPGEALGRLGWLL